MTNVRFVLFVALQNIFYSNSSFYDCPSEWIDHDSKCYKFVFHPQQSCLKAAELCKEEGADLLSVKSVTEHMFVRSWLMNFDLERNSWYTSGVVSLEKIHLLHEEDVQNQLSGIIQWGKYDERNDQFRHVIYKYSEGEYSWTPGDGKEALSYICDIPKKEAYRIVQDVRDFTYGTDYLEEDSVPKGPKFYLLPTDTDILRSTPEVYLECAAAGVPRATYQWTVTREDGQATALVGPRYTMTNGLVSISDPQAARDEGEYQCQAQNEFGIVLTPPVELAFTDLGEFSNVDTAPVRAPENQGTVIQCPKISSTSRLPISYNWIKDQNEALRPGLRPYLFLSGDGQLYFSEVSRGDGGMYYCLATLTNPTNQNNYVGSFQSPSRISTPIPLQVMGAPSGIFGVQIPDSFIKVFPRQPVVGSDVRFECFAYGTGPLVYQWKFQSIGNQGSRLKFLDGNRVLTIVRVTLQDSGLYTCVCSSRKSGTRDQKNYYLHVESKPMFVLPLNDQHMDKEARLTWRCQAYGIPPPTYTWYKNGQLLSSSSELTIAGNVLVIPRLREDMAGMYQCMASNTHGVTMSSGQLRVLSFSPTFKKRPMESLTQGSLGGSLTIQCHPEAAPRPNITWLYGGQAIPPVVDGAHARLQPLTSGHLLIVNLRYSDQGLYTCKAVNVIGSAQSSTEVKVLNSTVIMDQASSVTVAKNGSTLLKCRASHNSTLELVYLWHFNDHKIDVNRDSSFKMRGLNVGDLFITGVELRHAGTYKCTAMTHLDSASSSTNLKVLGPPSEPVGVHVVKGYKSGDPTLGMVQLAWLDGATHGSPIYNYSVFAQSNYSDSEWEMIPSVDVSPVKTKDGWRSATINDLSPGSSYRFRVSAINVYGEGPVSAPSDEHPIPGAAPVMAPRNIRRGKGKVGCLHVVWEPLPPADQNGWGIGYHVEWRLPRQNDRIENDWEKKTLVGNQSKFVAIIGGADQYYIQYQVRVTAYNMFGDGRPSAIQHIYTADGMPVVVPRGVKVEAYNSTALLVHWTPITDSRDVMKGRLQGYQVNYWLRDKEEEIQAFQATFSGQTDQGLIIGLLPGEWYYITVQVYNDAGSGQKSEKYPGKPFKPAPRLYPTNIHVHSYSSNSVQVTFRGVSIGTSEEPLLGYKIRVWEMSQSYRQARDMDIGRVYEGIVSGIKRDTVYMLRVLGYSNGGDGARSAPTTMFTLGGSIQFDASTTQVLTGSTSRCTSSLILTLIAMAFNVLLRKFLSS